MLHFHRSERADRLVDVLGELLARPLSDPLAPEVVAVPTRGVERWLTQRLSERLGATAGRSDGVCANLDFPFPASLVGDALAVATGVDPSEDRWRPERALWPLLEVFKPGRLGDLSRFAAARHVADLFDRYAVHRPQMIHAWARSDDTFDDGRPLPGDVAWQAEQWRRLRERIGEPSPAERLQDACRRLATDQALSNLPERFSVFGLTRLPASYLEVLRAFAVYRDVHLFLLHPSGAHWSGGAPDARNPLLQSWGRDAREMQVVLGAPDYDNHYPLDTRPRTLLEHVQTAIRDDRPPEPGATADDTLQIHACHGAARQVEVLRDVILGLLADDPTLEPRDVIVMCPDIESFAPLIHATFGSPSDEIEATDLRVRLADRSIRQTNPVLGVVSTLLDLADSRLTASQVLDLAAREPVRRRFAFTDDDLEQIETWVASTNIRWGLDAEHRRPFQLERLEANTWKFGLDRLLSGVAIAGTLTNNVLPLDEVESTRIDLAGRFAELVARLGEVVAMLRDPKPVARWTAALAAAADLLTASPDDLAWQRTQLQRMLEEVDDESAGSSVEIDLADVQTLLAGRLRGRPTRANFRTGHLTVCTLVPMRSVPHRVVCLLGLDDGVFPRKTQADGDDLIAADPRPGDRDARTEDRQLLLDALLAATDGVVITYSGRDERTNMPRPPAVAVGELLDVIDATLAGAPNASARNAGAGAGRPVVTHHPLQPFDPRNFDAAAPRSFDRVALDGARALTRDRIDKPPFLVTPLDPLTERFIELDDLVWFVRHPIRAFLRQRLDVWLSGVDDEVADALPVELDNLEQWQVGQRMLVAHLAGKLIEDCVGAELARGALPPGTLGEAVLQEVRPQVENIARVATVSRDNPQAVDVHLTLDDGRTLTGTVSGLRGDVLQSVSYSRLSPASRLEAWVRFVAATAMGHRLRAETIGRDRCARIDPIEPADARRHLESLVDLRDRGMREPLPLYCKTSAAYVDPDGKPQNEWTSARWANEDLDPEHLLVYGGVRTLTEIEAETPRDDERWRVGEPSRFGQLAHRLWDGLLAVERIEDT